MSRTIQSYTVEGLQRRLVEMEREIRDLHRRGAWNYDREYEVAGGSGATANAAALLILAATGDPIASGGDLVSFAATVTNHGFADVVAGAQAIVWPTTAVGEIQVEFAWTSYPDGGKIEIEVDGAVPAWGLIADGITGRAGCKRRSVYIEADSLVSIRVTQTSGAAETADVFVEFCIPDPAVGALTAISLPLQVTEAIPLRSASATGETFHDRMYAVEWDGATTIVLSNASDGTGQILVDDAITVDVTHPDGSTASFTYDFFGSSMGPGVASGPFDLTSYMETGRNTVRVRLRDLHGSGVQSTEIWFAEA